jgi:ribonuclease-3
LNDPLARLTHALGHRFRDPSLLEQALTHRSLGSRNNERLEFLGDALLDAIIANALFVRHPDLDEGALSRVRSRLVSQPALAELAAELELGAHLRMAPGEMKSGGQQRASIQADAVEAVLGAVFLDGGYPAVERLILQLFSERLALPISVESLKDSKTRLQELLQARGLPLPVYSLESTSGEAHAQTFHVSCRVESLAVSGSGVADNRRAAEQDAAHRVLESLQRA